MQFSRLLYNRVPGWKIFQSSSERLSLSTGFFAGKALRPCQSFRSTFYLSAADVSTAATGNSLHFPVSANRRLICSQNQVKVSSSVQKASSRDVLLSPAALVITREYEWANIIVGFEQANKYTIRAAPGGEVVGFLAEVSHFR